VHAAAPARTHHEPSPLLPAPLRKQHARTTIERWRASRTYAVDGYPFLNSTRMTAMTALSSSPPPDSGVTTTSMVGKPRAPTTTRRRSSPKMDSRTSISSFTTSFMATAGPEAGAVGSGGGGRLWVGTGLTFYTPRLPSSQMLARVVVAAVVVLASAQNSPPDVGGHYSTDIIMEQGGSRQVCVAAACAQRGEVPAAVFGLRLSCVWLRLVGCAVRWALGSHARWAPCLPPGTTPFSSSMSPLWRFRTS
jgi:hypothetical protein